MRKPQKGKAPPFVESLRAQIADLERHNQAILNVMRDICQAKVFDDIKDAIRNENNRLYLLEHPKEKG